MTGSMKIVWGRGAGRRTCVLAAASMLLLAGCASNRTRAPVEDRVAAAPQAASSAAGAPQAESTPVLPGAENAGKPGYYTVKPGDKLIRIALENGQNWRDLVKWNKLENPNVIEVGQVLRVVPPGADPAAASTRPVASPRVETRPLNGAPPAASAVASSPASAGSPSPASAPVTAASGAPASAAAAPSPSASPAAAASATGAPSAREGDDDVAWIWPANGTVVVQFDDARSKGLAIAGKVGDPVFAAADGRVVYAGSGLRGYGNLLIVKHNNTYLTAYAHNQTLLVKEDQAVRRGQRIAEMGSTDAERVQLHFEIRRLGKPIDPAKLLPPR